MFNIIRRLLGRRQPTAAETFNRAFNDVVWNNNSRTFANFEQAHDAYQRELDMQFAYHQGRIDALMDESRRAQARIARDLRELGL